MTLLPIDLSDGQNKMLKNDNKLLDKLILITFLALFCSFLSALYISAVHAAAIVPNETIQTGTQPSESATSVTSTLK
jgi:hypothetical protein